MGEPARIPVGTDYEVLVGRGLLPRVPDVVPESACTVAIVHSEALPGPAHVVADAVRAAGRTPALCPVPDAESGKTAEVAAGLWGRFGRLDMTRSDAVVGIGGGAVTDLAGFVAATWLRGIAAIQVPTSLVGMVDAAVGGKTGINTSEGKNLVGSFHPPAGVLCDIDLLTSLPAHELVAGMAEVVKHGFIADPRTLELIETDPSAALDPSGPVLAELVERSVRVKAEVVAQDLREALLREILNYGHTFGHAVEQVEGYTWRHGHAVAVGLMYAATLGALAGHTPAPLLARHRSILSALGLPVSYPPGRWAALLGAMRRDKKSRGAVLRFVVLDDVGRPVRLVGPPEDLMRAAYEAIASGNETDLSSGS